ncbi:MAG: carcinine hydrolase/isopenicillin-N N-acyltransferase family protein [Anaerolineae bacterium]|nr:carcinine hydrolase/isopenicillin-N N-acyltransferase family protein [Anaerolineae bacterium]
MTRVDDHPLYVMHAAMVDYSTWEKGVYSASAEARNYPLAREQSWACSLFSAAGDGENALYGRNFDWDYSPALLLFNDPPDGYASVSVVDLTYLVPEDKVNQLTDLPLDQRKELLAALLWPFDGMNEHGLVVGMAAVAESQIPQNPDSEWITSLGIIREMLDHTKNVTQALDLMQSYNICLDGGPHLHYLIADAAGHSALVELYQGEWRVLPAKGSWQAATNFTLSSIPGSASAICARYDTLVNTLSKTQGKLTVNEAMTLLSTVKQDSTQWSVVYGIIDRSVHIAMGRRYDDMHTFILEE